MIFIDANGGKKKQRELVSQVAYFCINKLMPRLKKIEIDIQLNNIKDGAIGYCMMTDNNRTFEIEIDKKLDVKEIIKTICHEIVHVKQYVRNELGINDNNAGKDYFNLPYEKQAYKLQETLSEQFIKECNYEMA